MHPYKSLTRLVSFPYRSHGQSPPDAAIERAHTSQLPASSDGPLCGSSVFKTVRYRLSGGEPGGVDRGPQIRHRDGLGVVVHLDVVADVLGPRPGHARQRLERASEGALAAGAVHPADVEDDAGQPPVVSSSGQGLQAAAATYAATSSASCPVNSSAGIAGCESVAPSSICWRTSASNDVRSKPSSAGCWYAASRFGPIVPFDPAAASVWHPPHVTWNFFWPFDRSTFDGLATPVLLPHPDASTAIASTAARAVRTRFTGGNTTSRAPRRGGGTRPSR